MVWIESSFERVAVNLHATRVLTMQNVAPTRIVSRTKLKMREEQGLGPFCRTASWPKASKLLGRLEARAALCAGRAVLADFLLAIHQHP